MDNIVFGNVCPDIFSSRSDEMQSDIWLKDKVTFSRGQTYLIECASGTGKSSFCSYLLGMRNDFSGHIFFDGRDSSTFRLREWVELRRHGISLMFQELRLFPELSAIENVEIRSRLGSDTTEKEIRSWFGMLGLSDKVDSPLRLLSFGQQQRVALMRSLALRSDFILLDEPVSHLDEGNMRIMASLIGEKAKKWNSGVIVTSIGRHPEMHYDKIFAL